MASGPGATPLASATGDVIGTEPSEDWLSFVLEPGLGQDSFGKPLECGLPDGSCGPHHMEEGQMGSGKEDGGVGLDFFDANDGLEGGVVLPADDGLSWLSECADFEVPPPSSTLSTAVAPFSGSLDLLLSELGPSSGGGEDVTRKGARAELPESFSQPSAAVLRSEGEEEVVHFADARRGHASDKGRGDIGTGSDSSNLSAGTSPSSAGSGVRERDDGLCHGQGAHSGVSEWQGSTDRENGCADSPFAASSAKRSTPEPHTPSHYGRNAEDRGVGAALDALEKKQQQPQQCQRLSSANRAPTSKASTSNASAGKAGTEHHVSSRHHASSSTVSESSPHVEGGAAGVPMASPYCVTPGTGLSGHPLPMGYMPVHMPGHGGYAMPPYVRPSIPYPILPPPRGATRKAQRQRARAKAQAEASGAHGAGASAGAGAPVRAATTTPESSVSLAEVSKQVMVKAESETVGSGGDGGSSSSSKAEDPGSDNSEEGEGAGDRDKDKEKEAGDEDCDKRQARLIRNRESAHLSRQRRKYYMEELESQLRTMTATVAELNNTIAHLTAENVNLRRQLAYFCPPAGMPAAGMGGSPGGLPAAAYGAAPGGPGGPVAGGAGQHAQVPGMHPGMMMGGHAFPPGMPPAMMGYRSFFQAAPPVPIPKLKSSKPDEEDKKNKKRKSGEAVGRDGGGQGSTQQQAGSPIASSSMVGASGAVKAHGAGEEDEGVKTAAAGGAVGKGAKGAGGGAGRKRVKGGGPKAPATVGLLSVVGLIMILCPLFPPPLSTWNAGSQQGLPGRFAVLPGLPWGNTREVVAPEVGTGEGAAAWERTGGRREGGGGGGGRVPGGGDIIWPSRSHEASGAAARHRGGGRVLMSIEDQAYINSTLVETTHNSPIILRANSTLNQILALAGGRLKGFHSWRGYVSSTKNRASSQRGLGPTEGTDATATSTLLRGQGPDERKRFGQEGNVSQSTTNKDADRKQEKEQRREQQQQQAVIPGNALALQEKQTEGVPVRPTEPRRRFETPPIEKGAVVKAGNSALPPARLPLEMSAQQLALLKALAVRSVGAAGQGHRESISGTSAAGRSSRGPMWALPPVASGDKGSAPEGAAGAEGAQEQQKEKPLFSWPLGSFIGSEVCTEVFQFDVGAPTPSPPSPAARHQPGNHSGVNGTLSCGGQRNSTHMANEGRAMPRRFGRSHKQKSPALPSVEPLRGKVVRKAITDSGPSGEVDVWRGGTMPESKADGSGAGEQSSVVVSILAGLDDEVARGLQGASKGTPSIFVVVLVNGVRYITYACLLPALSGKTGGSVMPL